MSFPQTSAPEIQPELNIYLIRHGESEGNIDSSRYYTDSDHALRLTPRGVKQAQAAGEFLAHRLAEDAGENGVGKTKVWWSPFYRTRETARHIIYPLGEVLDPNNPDQFACDEDLRLVEQRVGLFYSTEDEGFKERFPDEYSDYMNKKRQNGRAYAQGPMGESRIDTVFRVMPFVDMMLKDARRNNIQNIIIVTHGVTARALTVALLNLPPEWLNNEINPKNCWGRLIGGKLEDGEFVLRDLGYVHGENAPLGDPKKTHNMSANPEDMYFLKSYGQDPNRPAFVPPGVVPVDPFSPHDGP